jgi:hypothetical protein
MSEHPEYREPYETVHRLRQYQRHRNAGRDRIIDGVTTNLTLPPRSRDYRANLKKICDIAKGPVSGEYCDRRRRDATQGREIAAIDQQ